MSTQHLNKGTVLKNSAAVRPHEKCVMYIVPGPAGGINNNSSCIVGPLTYSPMITYKILWLVASHALRMRVVRIICVGLLIENTLCDRDYTFIQWPVRNCELPGDEVRKKDWKKYSLNSKMIHRKFFLIFVKY